MMKNKAFVIAGASLSLAVGTFIGFVLCMVIYWAVIFGLVFQQLGIALAILVMVYTNYRVFKWWFKPYMKPVIVSKKA